MDKEGAPSTYKLEESSLAHVLPVTGEPVYHTVPLLAARLIHHEGQIKEIHDHLEGLPLERNMSMARQGTNPSAIEQLITQRVADAMTAYEANRASRNGTHNEAIRSAGVVEHTIRGCPYKELLTCKPYNFKGTKGVIGLTCWFEKMESVFHISNCAKNCQVKFAACTLLDSARTWWNSYMKNIGLDVAYMTTWKEMKQIMINEYYPMNEIQKMKTEL
ncbi:hypothetical protein Tco_0854658 [Tanacetum coccineum]